MLPSAVRSPFTRPARVMLRAWMLAATLPSEVSETSPSGVMAPTTSTLSEPAGRHSALDPRPPTNDRHLRAVVPTIHAHLPR